MMMTVDTGRKLELKRKKLEGKVLKFDF